MSSSHGIGLQSESVAVGAPPALGTIGVSWASTLVHGQKKVIRLSGQNFIRKSKCLTPHLSLQGVGFLFL